MKPASFVNLTLRVLTETGIVGGLAYWGVRTGDTTAAKVLLGIGAPLIGFGIWGAVDFRGAARHAELLRLLEELAISAAACAALVASGRPAIGVALAGVSVAHHALVYAIGERLLKPGVAQPRRPGRQRTPAGA
jgi:Protein of unknown function (DUF2568)